MTTKATNVVFDKIGLFEVASGELLFIDPCYESKPELGAVCKAENGVWKFLILRINGTQRNSTLVFVHESVAAEINERDVRRICEHNPSIAQLGVDAGMLGGFDRARYMDEKMIEGCKAVDGDGWAEHSLWYRTMCAMTLRDYTPKSAATFAAGAVSGTAWGDGCYPLIAGRDELEGKLFIIPTD